MNTSPRHIGIYALQERLGENSSVEVWKALDTQSQCYVAIKLLHLGPQATSDFVAHFEHEARTLASLHHPNIVPIRDLHISHTPDPDGMLAYIVTDYVEGQTLADYISSTSRMREFPSAPDIVRLFTSISVAIDYAHQHGVIHRNIKPGNILLDKRHSAHNAPGEPILTDFSMSNFERTSTDATTRGQIETALYSAPEQARGYSGNELSDIYSLGVILYEICTGVPPFQGDTANTIKAQHINNQPTSPVLINPHIPPVLANVIIRGLAKDAALRFSTASSMSRALAEAFDLPVPEHIRLSTPQTDQMNEPTYFRPLLTNALPVRVPPSSTIDLIKSSSPPLVNLSTSSQQAKQSIPIASPGGIPADALANSSMNIMVTSSSKSPRPSPPPNTKKRRKGLIITLVALLILVLLGSGLGTFFLLSHGTPGTASQIIGHAYFMSSGELNADSTQGINDELLIQLQHVPDPTRDMSYYAWLLPDHSQSSSTPLLLGKMPVHHGVVNQLYLSPHNTDLLTTMSRLLITEEKGNTTPANSTPIQSSWQYYAELSQSSDPTDTTSHASTLSHLRYLLSEAPTLKQEGLSGGLTFWLVRNTGKVLEWAGSARDNWTAKSPILLRQQLVSILEYLDGPSLAQADLPPHIQLPIDPRFASIPLLELDTQHQAVFDYSYEIRLHLTAIAQASNATSDQHAIVTEINIAIQNVKSWLKQIHDDAEQLVKLTNAQLLLPSSQIILDDMQTQAFYAYIGRSDPSTGKVQAGVMQIQYDTEHLATFDITPYTSK